MAGEGMECGLAELSRVPPAAMSRALRITGKVGRARDLIASQLAIDLARRKLPQAMLQGFVGRQVFLR